MSFPLRYLFLLICLAACKQTFLDKESFGKKNTREESQVAAAGANQDISLSSDQFYSIWKKPYEVRLDKLPISGEAERIPYSGSGYAEITGGTNVSGALTRYDSAFGTKAAEWEGNTKNHSRERKSDDDGWHGHCNAFAAAAQRHKEPFKSVKVPGGKVEFSPSDIKALLAEVYMSNNALFLSGLRCNKESKDFSVNPYTRPDPERMSDCEDVNPGVLHLVIANWLGLAKHAFIIDFTIARQIWNYPTYKFSCDNCSGGKWKYVTQAQALDIIGKPKSGAQDGYIFNRFAKQWAEVKISLTRADIFENERVGATSPGKVFSLHYIVEVDGEGAVIGGEWASDNQQEHLDFAWVSLEPTTPDGNPRKANPHVDFKRVFELWKLSIGDPNPEWDIVEPVWQTSWGKFADYTVSLDGRQSGSVMGGKPTRLRLVTRGDRSLNDTFDILLNKQTVKSGQKFNGKEFNDELNPPVGINELQLVWKQSGEKQTLYFHVLP